MTEAQNNLRARLNLRLPKDLVKWMRKYAETNNTTMTQLLINYFTDLKKRTEVGDVPQF